MAVMFTVQCSTPLKCSTVLSTATRSNTDSFIVNQEVTRWHNKIYIKYVFIVICKCRMEWMLLAAFQNTQRCSPEGGTEPGSILYLF